jgi:hypothetical protein
MIIGYEGELPTDGIYSCQEFIEASSLLARGGDSVLESYEEAGGALDNAVVIVAGKGIIDGMDGDMGILGMSGESLKEGFEDIWYATKTVVSTTGVSGMIPVLLMFNTDKWGKVVLFVALSLGSDSDEEHRMLS